MCSRIEQSASGNSSTFVWKFHLEILETYERTISVNWCVRFRAINSLVLN